MREIKFRAWHKDTKRMYKTIYININDENIQVVFNWYRTVFPIEDFELLQYTGLKDKDWKEIYEWDILQRFQKDGIPYSKVYVVPPIQEFIDKLSASSWKWMEEYIKILYDIPNKIIIWNIYENPDLLNK